jgi:hypothetical protein
VFYFFDEPGIPNAFDRSRRDSRMRETSEIKEGLRPAGGPCQSRTKGTSRDFAVKPLKLRHSSLCAPAPRRGTPLALLASNEIPAHRRVDFDTTVAAMALTAKEMNAKYKETSEGGLAVSVTLC